MKFSGKNFQPWPEFSCEISGFTVVIGPSNKGKSALYRALRGVLRNELDTQHIRNPKNEPLELRVENADHVITASRSKKGSVKYDVDGQPFAKLDGEVPDIVRGMKFGEVKIGDFTVDPIFASQNRAQFLIDNQSFKPTEINAILGAFGGTEKFEAGKKSANLQKSQKDGEARVLAGQIRLAEERRAELTNLSNGGTIVAENTRELEARIRKLEAESLWTETTGHILTLLAPLHELAEALVLPDTGDMEELEKLHVTAEQAASSSAFARWMNKPLKSIEGLTAVWNDILGRWKQIKSLNETVALLSGGFDTQELQAFHPENFVNDALSLHRSIELLEDVLQQRRVLQETTEKSALIDDQLSAAESELIGAQRAIQDAAIEAERQRVEELTAQGLCPKCGQSMEHTCR